MSSKGIREQLSWALNGDSADAIKSHGKALLSEVERIEGAAAREAQTRGWYLNEIEDLVRGMLAETQCTLREADSTLYERKAAHHAACVEVLAGEASEVLDGGRRPPESCADGGRDLGPLEVGLVPTERGRGGFRWMAGKSRGWALRGLGKRAS
jgi:hypothetical protein